VSHSRLAGIAPLPLLASLLLAGCATMKVGADFDRTIDFSKLRSFGFAPQTYAPATVQGQDPRVDNQLVRKRIRAAVASDLTARGYREVVDGEPDFLISFHVGSKEKVQVYSTPSTSYAYGYPHPYWVDRWGVTGTNVRAHTYTEGMLVIDIVDPRTNELIWHGWATDTIRESAAPGSKVAEAVSAILSKFPPLPSA